jgi:hypothetical protein
MNVGFTAIWQWGFIERVSTGLILYKIGFQDYARKLLEVADVWATIEAEQFRSFGRVP